MPAMLMYPQIDPVALQVGPLSIHWYGLTYLAGFALFMFLGMRRLRHDGGNRAALGDGGRHEDRDVGVAREIARTTDAILDA